MFIPRPDLRGGGSFSFVAEYIWATEVQISRIILTDEKSCKKEKKQNKIVRSDLRKGSQQTREKLHRLTPQNGVDFSRWIIFRRLTWTSLYCILYIVHTAYCT